MADAGALGPDGLGGVGLGPIRQVAVPVADIAEAECFYGEVLGLSHLYTVGNVHALMSQLPPAKVSQAVQFLKYQALGNDYLVAVDPAERGSLDAERIRQLCHRHFGIGSDGILLWQVAAEADFSLVILNPDGSEAEKSGNGLRIFARFLWDTQRVTEAEFSVDTLGGRVRCEVGEGGERIRVEMGRVRFDSDAIPVRGHSGEFLNQEIVVAGEALKVCAATVGNPHCVVFEQVVNAETARRLGPAIEIHALFPQRTNVQFVEVVGENSIRIEIWERGAGYTLASGSSSCAAAATCVRLGLVASPVRVLMPGGELEVMVAPDFAVTMTGPASQVFVVETVADTARGPELVGV